MLLTEPEGLLTSHPQSWHSQLPPVPELALTTPLKCGSHKTHSLLDGTHSSCRGWRWPLEVRRGWSWRPGRWGPGTGNSWWGTGAAGCCWSPHHDGPQPRRPVTSPHGTTTPMAEDDLSRGQPALQISDTPATNTKTRPGCLYCLPKRCRLSLLLVYLNHFLHCKQ